MFTRKHGVDNFRVVGVFDSPEEAKHAEWALVKRLDAEGLIVMGAGRTKTRRSKTATSWPRSV